MRLPLTALAVLLFSGLLLYASDAIKPLAKNQTERVVEVAIFQGGYGIGWHKAMAEKFNAENASRGVRIELWGDPRTAEIIKPRLLRGNPPDLVLDERLPLWLLIASNKLTPFTDALAVPAPGSDKPWGELFDQGMLDMFKSDGDVYALPAAYGAWLVWYDAKMFREHGWQVPQTWPEFIALCEQVKAAGIAPWTVAGKYPYFYGWNTYVAFVQREGGLAAINRINALEPGAFSHPDVVKASRRFQDLALNYLQRGAMAMTHTESQLQFVQGNVAMIFCGLWLENEMKNSTPPDFEMRAFTLPTFDGGKGNPRLFHGQGMEYLFVPRDGKNSDIAFEFARYLVSPAAAPDMGRTIGVISPLEGATPRDTVSLAQQSALDVIEASQGLFNVRAYMLFPAWRTQVMGLAIAELLRGEITPEEFGKKLDDGIAAAKADPDVIIPGFQPYDPAAFGEQP